MPWNEDPLAFVQTTEITPDLDRAAVAIATISQAIKEDNVNPRCRSYKYNTITEIGQDHRKGVFLFAEVTFASCHVAHCLM